MAGGNSVRQFRARRPDTLLIRISLHGWMFIGVAGRGGLKRLRKNIPPRIITPAPKAPPLLNQEGSDQRTPLLR